MKPSQNFFFGAWRDMLPQPFRYHSPRPGWRIEYHIAASGFREQPASLGTAEVVAFFFGAAGLVSVPKAGPATSAAAIRHAAILTFIFVPPLVDRPPRRRRRSL